MCGILFLVLVSVWQIKTPHELKSHKSVLLAILQIDMCSHHRESSTGAANCYSGVSKRIPRLMRRDPPQKSTWPTIFAARTLFKKFEVELEAQPQQSAIPVQVHCVLEKSNTLSTRCTAALSDNQVPHNGWSVGLSVSHLSCVTTKQEELVAELAGGVDVRGV